MTGEDDLPDPVPPMEASASRPLPPMDKDDFWSWLSSLAPADWDNIIAYLWRTQPTIDRRQNGRPSNIRKYANIFDLDRVMLDEGSGGYRVDVCWRDPKSGKSVRIGQHYFQIMNMDYPPRVPPGDWLNDPENETWRWAEGKLLQEQATRQSQVLMPGQNPGELLQTVVSVVEKLRPNDSGNSAVATEMVKNMGHLQTMVLQMSDPAKQLQMITTLVGLMNPAKGEDPMIKHLLEELRDLRKRPEAKPLLEQVVEALPTIERVMGVFGFTRAGRAVKDATNWGDVAIQALEKIGDNVPVIADAIRSRNGGPGPGNGNGFQLNRGATAGRHAATSQPNANGAGAPPSAGAADPAPDPGEPTLPDEQKARYQAILDKYGPLIEAVAPFLIDQFRADLTGYDFRDWFINRQGYNNWQGLRTEVGPQTLTDLAQMHRTLRMMLAPKEKLFMFLSEFFTPQGDEPPGTVVDGPPAAGNPPPPASEAVIDLKLDKPS